MFVALDDHFLSPLLELAVLKGALSLFLWEDKYFIPSIKEKFRIFSHSSATKLRVELRPRNAIEMPSGP